MRGDDMTAVQARRALEDGSLTAADLLEGVIERLGDQRDYAEVWRHLGFDAARQRARQLDRMPCQGVLHGLPFAVDDLIDSCDMPTACGSPFHAAHQPVWDGAPLAAARAAGGILLGKTAVAEPGWESPGTAGLVRAVAGASPLMVCTGATEAALFQDAATDDVRVFHPTYHHIGRAGVRMRIEAFDVSGIVARSLEDVCLFRAALVGVPYERLSPIQDLRPTVAVVRLTPSSRCRDALDALQTRFAAMGVVPIVLDVSARHDELGEAVSVICAFELRRNFACDMERDGCSTAGERGSPSVEAYHSALSSLAGVRSYVEARIADAQADIVLAIDAPVGDDETPKGRFHGTPWSALHFPCMNVPPAGFALPLDGTVCLIERRHEDRKLLKAAFALERMSAEGRA